MVDGAAIADWWSTLSTEQRIEAQTAVARGAMPEWMAHALIERLGPSAVSVWWEGEPDEHEAPYRTTAEIAAEIAAQRD